MAVCKNKAQKSGFRSESFAKNAPTFRRLQKACAMRSSILLPLIFPWLATGQSSTFDSGNEGWTTFGDAASPNATWVANGGNPGGFIRATDLSTGGTWHFVAPSRFTGNKCDAYGNYLRYDQITSDTTNEDLYGDLPDVVLFGAGLVLVYENDENPNLTWTHYDVLLREDAGWRLNSITGAVPTEAQFRAVLADLDGLRIRGEYRPFDDVGGLDNVVLESSFGFDLDGDDSSGASNGDFRSDTLCVPSGAVADLDAVLFSEKPIDSIVIRIQNATVEEYMELDAIPAGLDVYAPDVHTIVLRNAGGATAQDFLLALPLLHYNDLSAFPARGQRLIEFRVFTECGEIAVRYARLLLYPKPHAGGDADTLVCAGSPPFDLFALLKDSPQTGGMWYPQLSSGNGIFDAAKDPSGTYAYFFPNAGECPGDTAFLTVRIEKPFQLRPDTTICYEDTLIASVPPGVTEWQWNDGSRSSEISIALPGTYILKGELNECIFTDSLQVGFYTCEECPYYAPNVFSPNDDGVNDIWQVYLPCNWIQFNLRVYDRWGGLVFSADDPENGWDGSIRGREAVPGVYVWSLEWTGELLGERRVFRAEGDVSIVR